MDNKLFKKYYSALTKEGILKSLVLGFIAGFLLSLIVLIISLIAKQNWLLISIFMVFGIAALLLPILYFVKFRPTAKTIAKRIDRLGLEERIITMLELSNDSSYIAMRQREDAKERLKHVKLRHIKLYIPKLSVALLSTLAVFWIGLATLSVLLSDFSNTPNKPLQPFLPEYIRISYIASVGGYITGESEQLVIKGEDSLMVVAVPNEGFAFDGWSDFTDAAERFDKRINKQFSVTARFVSLTDSSSGGTPNSFDNSGTGNSSASGGKLAQNNQIIDGQTYYRDYYQEYYDEAMQIIADGGEISDRLRSIIERYFGVIL